MPEQNKLQDAQERQDTDALSFLFGSLGKIGVIMPEALMEACRFQQLSLVQVSGP